MTAAKTYTKFLKLVEAAGMTARLKGAGAYTVFAPTDKAFNKQVNCADFRAAHFEARRALYATTVFCNFAVFGGSCLESPDKAVAHLEMPAGEERLEVVEIPVIAIRAEREAWDARAHRRFIQSTRR